MDKLTPKPPVWRREAALPVFTGLVVLVMLAVLASGAALTLRITGSLTALRFMTAEAEAVTGGAQSLQLALSDAEVASTGFLLTERPGYLLVYNAASKRVQASLAVLAEKAGQQAWLPADFASLQKAAGTKMVELGSSLAAVQSGGIEAGRALQRTQDAVGSTAAVRAVIDLIVRQAGIERDNRSAAAQHREHTVMLGVLLLAVGGVLLLGTAALTLLGGRSRLLQAQAATRAQGARWQATVESLPEGVAVFDSADRLLLWNRNLWPVTGLPKALAAGGTPFRRFAEAAGAWDPAILDGPVTSRHIVRDVNSGDRVLTVGRGPMPGGGQMLVIGDATRRVQTEAIARQAQKMDVLGQLTGGVAHDFNNLLQAVSANLELMSARVSQRHDYDAGWLRERLSAAAEGVARGARLTRHLLAFARRQPLAPEPVDTARLLTGLDDLLRRTVGQSVTMVTQLAPDLWPLLADAQQLENAILNLAINGRDAMATPFGPVSPAISRLTLTAANATLSGGTADAAGVAPGDYVAITVADTGCGMTPEQMARAVEPFYTTKPEGRGTGLGLPMAYGFAQQSGGNLVLASVVGTGTQATLYIPRTFAVPQEAALPRPSPGPMPGHGELILLVEDEPDIRAAAALSLHGLGYRVTDAPNPDQAWLLLEAGLRPDLLFSDVMMPGIMTARELARRAEALQPGLPVIFTSGYSADALTGLNGTLPAILPKPWRIEELAQRIRTCLQASAAMPPRRILLVEDDVSIRTLTAEMLEEMGHTVTQASDASSALAALNGTQLLITDLGLGGTDGLALAASAREHLPGLPTIIATGRVAPRLADADGIVWLAKPFDGKALRAAIHLAVDAERPVVPASAA